MNHSLEQKIEERKNQAKERNIFDNAINIAETLGNKMPNYEERVISYYKYSKKELMIYVKKRYSRDVDFPDAYNEVGIVYRNNQVFFAGNVLGPIIERYIQGEWETKLELLLIEVGKEKTKKELEKDKELIRSEDKKRQNFGL